MAAAFEEGSFRKTITKTVGHRYLAWLPAGYADEPWRRWPLLLFLHGAGERGDDLALLLKHGPPKMVAGGMDLPFVLLAPQCPFEDDWSAETLGALLDEAELRYRIDPDRIYLTGLSRGGSGVVDLAIATPERFAALAPICASSNSSLARRIVHIPAWFFHGAKDPVVPVQSTENMVRRLEQFGAAPRVTIYPDAGHDAWTPTYANPELYAWLASQARRPSAVVSA
jgi:predicted peptidase